jgi:hypothetical protein
MPTLDMELKEWMGWISSTIAPDYPGFGDSNLPSEKKEHAFIIAKMRDFLGRISK